MDTVTLVLLIGIVVVRSLIHTDLNQISLRVVRVELMFLIGVFGRFKSEYKEWF